MARDNMSSVLVLGVFGALLIGAIVFLTWSDGDNDGASAGADQETSSSSAGTTSGDESGGEVAEGRVEIEGPKGSSEEGDAPSVFVPSVMLRGRVLDAVSGNPIEGALVLASNDRPSLHPIDLSNEVATALSSGPRRAVHDLQDSLFGDSEPLGIPTPSVESEVSDEVPETTVPFEEAVTRTASDGSFEIGVGDSEVYLSATAPFYMTTESILVGPDDQGREIELHVHEVGGIQGVVLDDRDVPVVGAVVELSSVFNPMQMVGGGTLTMMEDAETTTDDSGRFSFGTVPIREDLSLLARHDDYASGDSIDVVVEPKAWTKVELRLDSGSSIKVVVHDSDGTPVDGAKIKVDQARIEITNIRPSQFQALSGWTDVSGTHTFKNVRAGEYRVEVAHDRYRPVDDQQITLDGNVPEQLLTFTLVQGLSVKGQVLASSGEPIAGARIEAADAGLARSGSFVPTGFQSSSRTRTNQKGEFTLVGLEAKTYNIQANARGFVRGTHETEAGGPAITLTLSPCASLEGHVLAEASGDPITEFDLKVERSESSLTSAPEEALALFLKRSFAFGTDDGSFKFTGMVPGTYKIRASAEGYGEVLSEEISLQESEQKTGVIIRLPPESVLEGVVLDDESGNPVEGVSIQVQSGAGEGLIQRAVGGFLNADGIRTDQEGRFRASGLAAGNYALTTKHPSYASKTVADLTVATGQTLQGVEIRLEVGGEIYGTVRDDQGKIAEGVIVIVTDATGASARTGTTEADGQYRIEGLSPGILTVTQMPASMGVSTGDNASVDISFNTKTVTLEPKQKLRVDFGGDLGATATLTGVVTQGSEPVTGALVMAIGSSGDGGSMKTASTDDAGKFEMKGVAPGNTMVQVQKGLGTLEGIFAADMREVNLVASQTTHLEIRIANGSIEGTLKDSESGKPLEGVSVYASFETSQTAINPMFALTQERSSMSLTDANGKFILNNLKSGKYTVSAGGLDLLGLTKSDYALTRVHGVSVSASGTTSAGTLELKRAGVIEGTVRDQDGNPIANAGIYLRHNGQVVQKLTSCITDPAGAFRYAGVADGTYDVVCRVDRFALQSRDGIRVRSGETSKVSFNLTAGTDVYILFGEDVGIEGKVGLSFEVVGPDGIVVSGLLNFADLSRMMTQPQEPGVYFAGSFGPGTYRVRGHLEGKAFEKTFVLDGEKEMRVPLR